MTAIQSPYQATAGTAASLSVLTTEGDLLYENATPANARLAVGGINQNLSSTGSLPEWLIGLQLQAATAVTGYTLVNGTGNVITWTAPNDGLMHRALITASLDVTSGESGGQIGLNFTTPDNVSSPFQQMFAAALSANAYAGTCYAVNVRANTSVNINQVTALTGGAAKLFAEIWAS